MFKLVFNKVEETEVLRAVHSEVCRQGDEGRRCSFTMHWSSALIYFLDNVNIHKKF